MGFGFGVYEPVGVACGGWDGYFEIGYVLGFSYGWFLRVVGSNVPAGCWILWFTASSFWLC